MVETVYTIVVGMIFAMAIGIFVGGYAGDKVVEQTRSVFEMCKPTITSMGFKK